MILWRPIVDGLTKGMWSPAPSTSGGIGCVLQRLSTMTLRVILLCYGENFSVNQWNVILEQAILPSMQRAAENDVSMVTSIISESPTVSNLDFLSDCLPLPPPFDDPGLVMFASAAQCSTSAPSRPMGRSELLVEASFADFRHGGDGNLKNTHKLLDKVGNA